MAPEEDIDVKGERGGDTGNTKKQGKGAGSEKGDERREHRQHSGQTRNSPGARRTDKDEQPGEH